MHLLRRCKVCVTVNFCGRLVTQDEGDEWSVDSPLSAGEMVLFGQSRRLVTVYTPTPL